jgi:type II secretory pathway pseudopilin PulG
MARTHADERGETLIEVLITMVVMGIGLVAVVGAIASSVIASDSHRNLAQAEVIARDFAEAVKDRAQANLDDPSTIGIDEFQACPDAAFFEGTGFAVPSGGGWSGWSVAIGDPTATGDGVEYWLPDATDFPNGRFEETSGDPYTRADCLARYEACNEIENADDPALDEPACDLSYQRVTLTVSNSREDYAEVSRSARVLVRRPNP